MNREYCASCGDHTQNGVCEECDLYSKEPRTNFKYGDIFKNVCGECGSITNLIIIQCRNCGCAVCTECEDHEAKC